MVRKSGKNKIKDKSQVKMGVFENVRKKLKKKTSDFVSSNLPNSLYLEVIDR